MSTFVESQVLSTCTCANCGMLFAMPQHWHDERRKDHKSFHCPQGHNNYYPGESDEEKLRKQVAQLQTRIEHKDAEIAYQRDQRVKTELKCRAVRGVVTRIKNRIGAGVCPCCNRTFQCPVQHMKTQHPDYRHSET